MWWEISRMSMKITRKVQRRRWGVQKRNCKGSRTVEGQWWMRLARSWDCNLSRSRLCWKTKHGKYKTSRNSQSSHCRSSFTQNILLKSVNSHHHSRQRTCRWVRKCRKWWSDGGSWSKRMRWAALRDTWVHRRTRIRRRGSSYTRGWWNCSRRTTSRRKGTWSRWWLRSMWTVWRRWTWRNGGRWWRG